MEKEQMNVELSCECSTGKRPLYIRMMLKYIVKRKYKCCRYGRIRNICIIANNGSCWTRCCSSLHLLSIPI